MQLWINRIVLFMSLCFWALNAEAASNLALNMPYGVSPISHEIYDLHMATFYICCVIAIIVFGAIIYSLIKFRKSKGARASHFHEHLPIEIIWTAIPFLILVVLAIPAT